jgi:hypothetical protein
MPIPVICKCSAKLRIADHLRGQLIQCPKCGTVHPVDRGADQVLAESGLSDAERARLEKELEKDESLLWAGKPQTTSPTIHGWCVASGLFFMAIVVGVILFVMSRDRGLDMPTLLGTGGIGAVAIVAGLVYPFLLRRRWARTAYALTTKRALAWDAGLILGTRFQEYVAADLAHVYRTRDPFFGSRGIGALIFGAEVRQKDGQVVRRHGFFYIARVDELEKLLRERIVNPYTDRLYQ